MTHAVLVVLISLLIGLILHVIFLLVLLKSKSKEKLKQADHPILIVYASQSGQAESYAEQTAQQLLASGHNVQIFNIADFKVDLFKHYQRILWLVSTYGEGDAPDTARQFIRNVMTKSFELNGIQYAVLAFGDRHYSNFCEFGKRLNVWLADQQAQALFPMVCVDQLKQADLLSWQTQLNAVLEHNPLDQIILKQQPFYQAILSERHLLNHGSLGNPMFHLVLTNVEGLNWQSGDILEIQCANTKAQIENFIHHFQLANQTDIQQIDIFEKLQFKNLRTFDNSQNIEQWLEQAQDLAIREYSIASIPTQNQLELLVRQEIHQDGLGLGSGYLTQSLVLGDELNCRIRSNPAFHLIENNAPMIFIGNGSGIAGLISHIRQRESLGLHKNWLIYGERQQSVDRIFEKQLSIWQKNGVLSEIDLAFSRDENTQKYVQDCLIVKSTQLKAWIEQGASIYICGSIHGMAQSVEKALIEILGLNQFEQLIEQKRYLRDVY